MRILRPHYEAAVASLPAELAMSHAQRLGLWQALVVTTGQAQRHAPRWSPEAIALRAPLQRELKVLRQHADKGSIINRYLNVSVTLPTGGNNQPPRTFNVMEVYAQYCQRLPLILDRIDSALRTHGHWGTEADDPAFKQPLEIVVANERAQGRPAGTTDWTQWETPGALRAITKVFDLARVATQNQSRRGRQWAPYLPNGDATRGAAADARVAAAWRGAFHDAIAVPLGAAVLDPDAGPLARFYRTLRDQPAAGRIEDAIRTQMQLRRGPANRAFAPPASVWHALDNQTRLELAAAFDAALRECNEALVAKGSDRAPLYSPVVIPNPWALPDTPQEAPARAPAPTRGGPPPEPEPEPDTSFLDKFI